MRLSRRLSSLIIGLTAASIAVAGPALAEIIDGTDGDDVLVGTDESDTIEWTGRGGT